MVPADARSETRAHLQHPRLQLKIVQALKTHYDIAEGRRNGRLAGVGKMPFSFDDITVYLRAQRRFHLLCRPAEGDHVLTGGYAFDVKFHTLQPSRHFVDIALA